MPMDSRRSSFDPSCPSQHSTNIDFALGNHLQIVSIKSHENVSAHVIWTIELDTDRSLVYLEFVLHESVPRCHCSIWIGELDIDIGPVLVRGLFKAQVLEGSVRLERLANVLFCQRLTDAIRF